MTSPTSSSPQEFLSIRASELLGQQELVGLLKTLFPRAVKRVGRLALKGYETIEVRIPTDSPHLSEIRELVSTRRAQDVRAYSAFTIGQYSRKYTVVELEAAEVLLFHIESHFEPAGEECGTVYKTNCHFCNMGSQLSELVLDLGSVPQRAEIAASIALNEWICTCEFAQICAENNLSGINFLPVIDVKDPTYSSRAWLQMQVTGIAGRLSDQTVLGKDPFSPSQVSWRCPLGHSVATQILSEVYLDRKIWDGSDFSVSSCLLGQGRNLVRPIPLIFISQRAYRALKQAGLSGYSVEVAHLV